MSSIAIVDYGMCNLDSIRRAVEDCGATAVVTGDPADLKSADRIILPGVGSFSAAMSNLRASGLDAALIAAVVTDRIPLLGVCLGMHLLMDRGSEGGHTQGLGLLRGDVVLLDSKDQRVPHVGWNEVHPVRKHGLLHGIAPGKDFYFVHSYRVRCAEDDIIAQTPYGDTFTSVVAHENVVGVQFHPEKSQKLGLMLLRNFLAL